MTTTETLNALMEYTPLYQDINNLILEYTEKIIFKIGDIIADDEGGVWLKIIKKNKKSIRVKMITVSMLIRDINYDDDCNNIFDDDVKGNDSIIYKINDTLYLGKITEENIRIKTDNIGNEYIPSRTFKNRIKPEEKNFKGEIFFSGQNW